MPPLFPLRFYLNAAVDVPLPRNRDEGVGRPVEDETRRVERKCNAHHER